MPVAQGWPSPVTVTAGRGWGVWSERRQGSIPNKFLMIVLFFLLSNITPHHRLKPGYRRHDPTHVLGLAPRAVGRSPQGLLGVPRRLTGMILLDCFLGMGSMREEFCFHSIRGSSKLNCIFTESDMYRLENLCVH